MKQSNSRLRGACHRKPSQSRLTVKAPRSESEERATYNRQPNRAKVRQAKQAARRLRLKKICRPMRSPRCCNGRMDPKVHTSLAEHLSRHDEGRPPEPYTLTRESKKLAASAACLLLSSRNRPPPSLPARPRPSACPIQKLHVVRCKNCRRQVSVRPPGRELADGRLILSSGKSKGVQ